MTQPLGISLPDRQPLLHYAARQDVLIWLPSAMDGHRIGGPGWSVRWRVAV